MESSRRSKIKTQFRFSLQLILHQVVTLKIIYTLMSIYKIVYPQTLIGENNGKETFQSLINNEALTKYSN